MHLSNLPAYLCLGLGLGGAHAISIWPAPIKLESGNTTLFIDQTLSVTYNGEPVRWQYPHDRDDDRYLAHDTKDALNVQLSYTHDYDPASGSEYNSKEVVQAAVSRTLSSIFQTGFVPWMMHKPGDDYEPDQANSTGRVLSLQITQSGTEDGESPFKSLTGEVDESYKLELSEDGKAEIEAETSIGVLRALDTFSQLFYEHTSGTAWYTSSAPVSIEDEPQYPHRGIMMDTSRHFFPVKDILKTIDAMSWAKLNKLHLHITDSQSWPLHIPAMPELAARGAYAKNMIYSEEDLQRIQEYATHRGIQVVLEIDMPGHIGVVGLAYPEIAVAYNEQPYHWWCLQPPCGGLKLNDSRVDEFLDTLFDDLLPRVSPYTAYFHVGGDEINANSSRLDDSVGTNDTDVLQPLIQKFFDKNFERVRSQGLVPMVWQEVALDWNVTIEGDVVVQAWLGGPAIKELVDLGHKVIDSNSNYWYMDCGRGAWINFDNGEAYDTFYPFNDWCTPTKGWMLVYSHDPREGLTEEEGKLVLGGEATGWSETIDPVNFDMVMWPRASALGEVLWSGRVDPGTGQNRSIYDAAPRLQEHRERMVIRGVGAAPITQMFCTQTSPEECGYNM